MLPLGSKLPMACFCTLTSTPSATFTLTKASPILETVPAMPPLVTTSSPLFQLINHFLCSLTRLCCGRIKIKKKTTNKAKGKINADQPPPEPCPPWAAAVEIKKSHRRLSKSKKNADCTTQSQPATLTPGGKNYLRIMPQELRDCTLIAKDDRSGCIDARLLYNN